MADSKPHVVIIGGGFGGLKTARMLARAPVRITLIDRSNHHLFQPLLYQVAMSGLSDSDIAMPIRAIFAGQKNLQVLLCEASGIDLEQRQVEVLDDDPIPYDYLILAAGAQTNYFGHDEWAVHALGLKDIDDALEIRRRVLLAYETAERERDAAKRQALMTFVIIGGGPTGVELAGAIAELGRWVLAKDFRNIDPQHSKVILLEGADRILMPFDPSLSVEAQKQLEGLGVQVRTGAQVTRIDEDGVYLGDEHLPAWTTLWAAGVMANPLTAGLGVELDRGGRVIVQPDCSIDCHANAFAIGDIACFVPAQGQRPLPGVSPVAIQQAKQVAVNIRRDLDGKPRNPFVYRDKGSMATIGRSRAVAQMRGLKFSGTLAWLAWLFVHIWYLIGFRNRVFVMLNWFWAYLAFKRGARLVTGTCLHPRVRRKLEEKGKKPARTCRE